MYHELLKQWTEERLAESSLLEMGMSGVLALKDFVDWLDKHAAQHRLQSRTGWYVPASTVPRSNPF